MPNGKIHNFSTLTVAVTSLVTISVMTGDIRSATYCASGALVGLICTPDWDLDGPRLTFGEFLEHPVHFIWRVFLLPYSKIMPHRSVGSHAPILSTFLRGLYVLLWIWPFWLYYGWQLPTLQAWMLWGGWGLVIADFCHWLLDFIDNLLGGSL